MLEWGRLGDLVKNGRRLAVGGSLFLILSQDHIQLLAIELNTGSPNLDYGQLFKNGIDAKGIKLDIIGGGYADRTIEIKDLKGLPINRVTLYDEGDFYKSWHFKHTSDGFILEADTIKYGEDGEKQDLQDRWGDNLIGLTNESINTLNQEILPELIELLLSELLQ